MLPDESLFRKHLEEAFFQIGTAKGRWGLHDQIIWPHAILWCRTEISLGEVNKIFLRFTLNGYSENAPTACPWDVEKNQKLEPALWPKGNQHIQNVFNPANEFLYAPCDGKAMPGHSDWSGKHKAYSWMSDLTIVTYLTFVFELLNLAAE